MEAFLGVGRFRGRLCSGEAAFQELPNSNGAKYAAGSSVGSPPIRLLLSGSSGSGVGVLLGGRNLVLPFENVLSSCFWLMDRLDLYGVGSFIHLFGVRGTL